LLPEIPICEKLVPWLRIATVSSGKRPVTVSVPPLKSVGLPAVVKLTCASMSCGAALTAFSRKVTGVVRPVRIGTAFAIS
jgi:hypothetical protein